MRTMIYPAIAALLVGACAQKSAYEVAVEDYEPVYCYKSIGGVACYEEPYHRDERRLVNYFGPAPIRYDRPDEPDPQKLFAPQPVDFWVKDPEPVPKPAPKGDLADRPWLINPILSAEPAVAEAAGSKATVAETAGKTRVHRPCRPSWSVCCGKNRLPRPRRSGLRRPTQSERPAPPAGCPAEPLDVA